MEEKKKLAEQIGLMVLILLISLSIGEFLLGAYASDWDIVWAPILLVASIKAFFVVRDFMHIGRLFSSEGEDH